VVILRGIWGVIVWTISLIVNPLWGLGLVIGKRGTRASVTPRP
jgi:hypothetical protein